MPWTANPSMISIVGKALEIQLRVKRLELLRRFDVAELQLKTYRLPTDQLRAARKALQDMVFVERPAEPYFPQIPPPQPGDPLKHLVVGTTEKRDF